MACKPTLVEVDVGLSAHANARRYYAAKKQQQQKRQKTLEVADQAIRSAERKASHRLKTDNTTHKGTVVRSLFVLFVLFEMKFTKLLSMI